MTTGAGQPTAKRRAQQAACIGVAMAAVTVLYQRTRFQPSDFAQLWFAAKAFLEGMDPYGVIGPDKLFEWPFPLLYPMPAVLAALPFTVMPLRVADPIIVGLGAFAFSWAVTRDRLDDPRLMMFVSGAGALAIQTSQWSPLLCAAAFIPTLGFLLACKPTLGLAIFVAYPSWRIVIGAACFTLLSLGAWWTWPKEWLDSLPAGTHLIAPITRPGGVLVLAALARWRRPEARLLVAWACMPQTPQFYEAVPLFLIPRTWGESGTLAGLTLIAGLIYRARGPYASYEAYMQAGGNWMLWLLFIPCAIMILRDVAVRAARPTAVAIESVR